MQKITVEFIVDAGQCIEKRGYFQNNVGTPAFEINFEEAMNSKDAQV